MGKVCHKYIRRNQRYKIMYHGNHREANVETQGLMDPETE